MTCSYNSTAEFFSNSGILTGINQNASLSDRIEGAQSTLEAASFAPIEGFDLNVAMTIIATAFGIEEYLLFLQR